MKDSSPKTMVTPPFYREVTHRPLIVTSGVFCYLDWGVRKKQIITISLLLPCQPRNNIHQKIQIITDDNAGLVQSLSYDSHFSPSLLTYFQSAALCCLAITHPHGSNTDSMKSRWHRLWQIKAHLEKLTHGYTCWIWVRRVRKAGRVSHQ